jgi:uncharacterized protein YecE (DUF72 family)
VLGYKQLPDFSKNRRLHIDPANPLLARLFNAHRMENAIIRIGTGGWSYPSWKKNFYPAGLKAADEFAWYTQKFSSIELNNTFYKLPSREQFFEWKQRAPADFIFSIKASRFITQMKKLKTDTPAVQRLLDNAAFLEEKLGPILFELPPRWKLNTNRLREFLEHIPKGYLYAFEFREPTWFAPGSIRTAATTSLCFLHFR